MTTGSSTIQNCPVQAAAAQNSEEEGQSKGWHENIASLTEVNQEEDSQVLTRHGGPT